MNAYIDTPITTLDGAKAFVRALHEAGKAFHFEDDPADIINTQTGEEVFTAVEVPHVRERVAEMYELDWQGYDCPIGYLLELEEANESAR